jgi:tryptophanyl-tRNA synthetase
LTVFSAFSGRSIEELERDFEGKGYAEFKAAAGECVADALAPLRNEYRRIIADKTYLETLLTEGEERAERIARKTLSKVYRKLGLR